MTVYPCLTYRDVRAALAWLSTAFEIQGHGLVLEGARDDDPLDHALLSIDEATILVESERPRSSTVPTLATAGSM